MTTKDLVKVETAERVPKGTASAVSLPACLERVTADGHRPGLIVGTVANGDWLPPVAVSGAEADALDGAIAKVAEALVPAHPDTVRTLLAQLAMNVRLEGMSEENWQQHLEDYIADLSDVPEDLIAEACCRWWRKEKFWPLISEFLPLVEPGLSRRRRMMKRLKTLKRVAADPAPDGVATKEWLERIAGTRQTGAARVARMRPLGQVLDDQADGG